MKYYIRTTLERQLNNSYSQIEYELLIDKEHNARKSFVEQLEHLATLNEDCVILEDDVLLCRDFKNKIEDVINEHKKDIISFFWNPNSYEKSRYTFFFNWNQCVYYPKELLKPLSVELRRLYTLQPNRPHDELEGDALCNLGIKTWIHRPFLVQHLDNDTLIQKISRGDRRTPYFIDYLDELGISYKEASKIDNLMKLINLMFEKFKEV